MSFLNKLNPRRAVDIILRRKLASAIAGIAVSAAAYYGYNASPEVQEAIRTLIEALFAAFGS